MAGISFAMHAKKPREISSHSDSFFDSSDCPFTKFGAEVWKDRNTT